MNGFHSRHLGPTLSKAALQFPAVVLTGPRQSGKTTLVRHVFGDRARYCTLDDPIVRAQAADDPNAILQRFERPLIVDEIQYAPGLLHVIKADIDAHPGERGRYVITGSQSFPLMQGVTETLAGRAAILSLSSFGYRELIDPGPPEADWRDALAARPIPGASFDRTVEYLLRGGFPGVALRTDVDRELWHASFVQTYLERDVRSLRAVGDLMRFQAFVMALAARAGALMSYSGLQRDVGVDGKTVKAWITVLEASGQVTTLRPYHANLGKRLVKRPKVFFNDSGVLAYLLGLSQPSQVIRGVAAGPLFENAVFGALLRLFAHRGRVPRLFFWRTAAGHEVGFIIEDGPELIPIEAKLTATPTPRAAQGIERLQDLLGERVGRGLVVCLCEERFPLTSRVDAVPFGAF